MGLVRGAVAVDNIAVAPDAQGSGLGRRLMDFAEAETARRGYVEAARRTERGFPRVCMAKDLKT